jgi:SulP family sulfate permease
LLDPDAAIDWLFHRVLDPAVCIYECPRRAFRECQNLPKKLIGNGVQWEADLAREVAAIRAQDLWAELHSDSPPLVLDVREPREYRQGHISGAVSIPLATALSESDRIPRDKPVVLVCRSGRRSSRAAANLTHIGYDNIRILKGGIAAWENANLLEAIGP